MPTTLPSLGNLQSKPTQPTPSDQGITYLNENYGVSPDGSFFYVRDERNGRQGWRRLNPKNPKDRDLIEQVRKILGQIPRAKLQQELLNALQKAQRTEGKANLKTTKADELAAKFGVSKPDANQNRTNNRSSLPETRAYRDDLSNYQNLGQGSTDLPDQPTQNNQLGLGSDVDSETQAKLPYQPKPDGGSQLPPLGSLRDGTYPEDYSGNPADGTNDGFSENRKARKEPDGDRYRPQWREEEGGNNQEESEDDVGYSGGPGDIPSRQPATGVSGSTLGSDNQRPDQSPPSKGFGYKDKLSQFAKNLGGSGQQGPLTNKLGQVASKASQTLQKAQQAAAKAKQAAQAAKQAAQVAKLAVQAGAQLIRLLLPLLIPLLKILLIILIILIVIVLLIMVISAIGSVLKPLKTPPPPTERLSLGQEVSVSSFIGYIFSDGFDFNDRITNFMVNGNPRFSLLPRENKKVEDVLQLISANDRLRNRINRLLYEGVRIKTNDNSYVSGLHIADSSVDNRIILRIAWMWVENDWTTDPPSLGPDWYLYNCADQNAPGGPANISPKKWDLSGHCNLYGSGQQQIAGFQLGDRKKDIKTAYQFCFKKEFPIGAGQIMQENLNYSSKATRPAWNYNNPAYDGKIPLGNLNTEFFATDFYPTCTSHACEARTQLLVKHPCMAMYLNTAADTWAGFNNNWGNSQVILSALHYYILDLKAGAS